MKRGKFYLKNEEIQQIRNHAITKQLNFLIGSGASLPAIPLMSNFEFDENGKKVEEAVANERLKEKIKTVSKSLVEKTSNHAVQDGIQQTLESYFHFIQTITELLYKSNSRQAPKNINIFTTNYDLFIEMAIDRLMKQERLIFNDGANGYFERVLDSSNYNKTVAYRGLNDNYLNEIPMISLIKPHGSMNWEKSESEEIHVKQGVVENPVVVPPTGYEGRDTFLDNHFHDMLRVFQMELDKPQSVLFVIGFSFQDQHIAKMIRRAIQNPELMIYIFCYSNEDGETIKQNLSIPGESRNLKIATPEDILEHDSKKGFTISDLTKLLSEFSGSEGDTNN